MYLPIEGGYPIDFYAGDLVENVVGNLIEPIQGLVQQELYQDWGLV